MTKPLFVGLLAASLLVGSACSSSPKWRTESGFVWGTSYHITYQNDTDLADSIIAVTDQINESLSMFSPTSTVAKINAGVSDSADRHFIAVYQLSKAVNQASNGLFDPTVAPLVDLWGFGRRGGLESVPDSASIDSILQFVGISKTRIDGHKLIKENPMTEFDFSAIAKGYGVDQVAEMLARNGVENFMVEIGGEIRLAGHNPSGNLWRIQIDAPVVDSAPGDSAMRVLSLTDCAIATSGNYRNHRRVDSLSYGHTISPLSGYPVQNEVVSATVIAPTCALADALATALMAAPQALADSILSSFPSAQAITIPE